MGDKAGYYAIIPAPVLYDQELTPRAKLLYAVVSNFVNFYGYCTTPNSKLADYFSCSETTIERLLKELRDKKYLYQEVKVQEGKTCRWIWLGVEVNRPPKNEGSGPLKNEGSLIKKNNINNPPIAPQGGQQAQKPQKRVRAGTKVELPPELEASFKRFWTAYPSKKDKQKARLRWLQIAPDDALVETILQAIRGQRETKDWQDGFIPYPSTWLNGSRWEDEVTPVPEEKDDWRYL